MNRLNFLSMNQEGEKVNEVNLDNLLQAMQQALEIEIATIPLYLHTYYSINRSPSQSELKPVIKRRLTALHMPMDKLVSKIMSIKEFHVLDDDIKEEFNKLSRGNASVDEVTNLLSTIIIISANKIAALIYSVFVEEMLHTALAANVLSGMQIPGADDSEAGEANFYFDGVLPTWPFNWAGHDPKITLDLKPLSKEQLFSFVEVESPSRLPEAGLLKASNAISFTTIGDFYHAIQSVIANNDIRYLEGAPKLDPGKGYYAQNNINSTYYGLEHQHVFENSEDAGDLISVAGQKAKLEALQALGLIVEQGEGAPNTSWDGKTIECSDNPEKEHGELSHFVKFKRAYCLLSFLEEAGNLIEIDDIKSLFIHPSAANPTLGKTYKSQPVLYSIANLTNAAFSYIFVMLDRCYKTKDIKEKDKVFISIHKSMMWIISTLSQDLMPTIKYKHGAEQYSMSPTFEYYDFTQSSSSPKAQMLMLVTEVINQAQTNGADLSDETIQNIINEMNKLSIRISTLEDVALPNNLK